jgi:putative inorganic carbon (HCO3(-)) transporter
MSVRDIAFIVILFGSLPVCFLRPWVGILVWSWMAYMNPHLLTWNIAEFSLAPAMLVAVPTISGFVLTKDRESFIWSRETTLIAVLWIWFTVTSMFALYPTEAWSEWRRVSKILLMVLLTIPLFQDRRRLRLLLLVIAGSIGFYGLKGGIFVVTTGGQGMVLGPPGRSFVSSNNALALALNMCLPLMFYLALEEPRRWLRAMLFAAFLLSILSVLFTYSRGGVLGLVVVLALLLFKTRAKLILIPAALAGLVALYAFAPKQWVARIETIQHYEDDGSARARLLSWDVSMRLADDHPIVGGGFDAFNNRETFDKYAPGNTDHDAHSIYFNLLGEHGYPGLFLFALLVFFLLSTLRRLRKIGGKFPELAWVSNYAHMLQASIVGYLITGAFLSVAYFDLAYHLFAIVVIVEHLATQALESKAVQGAFQCADTPMGLAAAIRGVGVRPAMSADSRLPNPLPQHVIVAGK